MKLAEEELRNNSQLIIDFMGWKMVGRREVYTPFYQYYNPIGGGMQQTSIFYTHETKFHSSWDWSMAVISKIAEDVMYLILFDDDDASFHKKYRTKIACTTTGNLKGAYSAVIEYIHWYNKRKD